MFYYDDCLEEKVIVTSTQTAFGIKLLWEYTTLMIVNKCAFEGLGGLSINNVITFFTQNSSVETVLEYFPVRPSPLEED